MESYYEMIQNKRDLTMEQYETIYKWLERHEHGDESAGQTLKLTVKRSVANSIITTVRTFRLHKRKYHGSPKVIYVAVES